MQLRVRALETILTEKGYVDPAALDAIVEAYETKIGPHNGARVVAKAWTDPAFKRALLEDATKAVATLGHVSRVGDHLIAVENTPERHNMVVCTLCSCYPWDVLGLPPVWYKSAPYRSRAVKDPRGVLADFGVDAAGRHRDPRLGLDRRDALHRAADAAGRHRGLERGEARRAGHARSHDRHRPARSARRSSRNERHPRHGRHARLRQGRSRSRTSRLPRDVGRPRAWRMQPRHGRTPAPGTSTWRASASSACRRRSISRRPITAMGAAAWRTCCSSAGFVGADEIAAGHALRPGKPSAQARPPSRRRR